MEEVFNLEMTDKVSMNAKLIQYKKWLSANGVKLDNRLKYPSYFGSQKNGVIGLSANKSIEKNHAIIAVPYNLLITDQKVFSVTELSIIIEQNPQIFKKGEDYVFKLLILYMCYQLIKGQKSFYHPYFQISNGSYLSQWKHWDMLALENRSLLKQIKQHQEENELQFMTFLNIFRRYETVFPAHHNNLYYRKLYSKAHGFICTRAFGWSLPSISLIPMADSLNHGNRYVSHYLVNDLQEENPSQSYQSHKDKSNLEIIPKNLYKIKEQNLSKIKNQKKTRKQKYIQKHKEILIEYKEQKIFQKDKKSLINSKLLYILYQQYKAEIKNIRQLHFYQTSCSEDNDTDQDTIYDKNFKIEQMKFYDRYERNPQNLNKNKNKQIQKYWKLYIDNFDEISEQQDYNKEQQLSNKEQIILQKYKQNSLESQASDEMSSTNSEEEDDKFEWLFQHKNKNNESKNHLNINDKQQNEYTKKQYQDTYFIMQTKTTINQNEQIYNFYGRRSNKYLLLGYNFVMNENQYDSYTFKMYINYHNNYVKLQPYQLIYHLYNKKLKSKSQQQYYTCQVRLKKYRVNIQFINHCRCYLISINKQTFINGKLMLPFQRQFQYKVLLLAINLIKILQEQYTTTVEQDQQLLQQQSQILNYQLYTAIKYRIFQKQILRQQLLLLEKCMQFLKRWKNQRIQKISINDLKWIKRNKTYLISLERSKI